MLHIVYKGVFWFSLSSFHASVFLGAIWFLSVLEIQDRRNCSNGEVQFSSVALKLQLQFEMNCPNSWLFSSKLTGIFMGRTDNGEADVANMA